MDIPDAELWKVRAELRHDLFDYIRERMRRRWRDEQVSPNRIVAAGAMLDPDALTIGYARRFTAYKRPELIFHDPERLARILNDVDRPVQTGLLRQGASRRRTGQAPPAAGLQALPRPGVRRTHRVHRRLRHARRPLPRARLRRVAEQPAQAARSQRHQRHEGGDERRAAPEHRRRLVGRGLQRPQRLADREPDVARRSGGDRQCRCRVAVHPARDRDRAGVLRPPRQRAVIARGWPSSARRCAPASRGFRPAAC